MACRPEGITVQGQKFLELEALEVLETLVEYRCEDCLALADGDGPSEKDHTGTAWQLLAIDRRLGLEVVLEVETVAEESITMSRIRRPTGVLGINKSSFLLVVLNNFEVHSKAFPATDISQQAVPFLFPRLLLYTPSTWSIGSSAIFTLVRCCPRDFVPLLEASSRKSESERFWEGMLGQGGVAYVFLSDRSAFLTDHISWRLSSSG